MSSTVCYRHSSGQETEMLLRSFAKFKYYTSSVVSTVHAFVVEFRELVET